MGVSRGAQLWRHPFRFECFAGKRPAGWLEEEEPSSPMMMMMMMMVMKTSLLLLLLLLLLLPL